MYNSGFDLFKHVVCLSQDELHEFLYKILQKYYTNIIRTKDYMMAEGDIPIALVAHTDTVFYYGNRTLYHDPVRHAVWSPSGLGADDRAGIAAIIRILRDGYRPTVIFTADEEIGALGAERMILDYPTPPWEIRYIIELDRQGSNDCVFYNCDNKEFEKYIRSFGFITQEGLFSDISIICPIWKIAGVNLSIGYIREHTLEETFSLKYCGRVTRKVESMLRQENIPQFEYIPKVKEWAPYPIEPSQICVACGRREDVFLMIPVDNQWYCPKCAANDIDWCNVCGAPYVIKKKSEHKCQEGQNGSESKKNPRAVQ